MTIALEPAQDSIAHPLDVLEELVASNDWPFDRPSEDELVAEIQGRWCDYRAFFAWSEDMSALHFACGLDLRLPRHRRGVVMELLALINERLWLGHFDLSGDEYLPTFRHAIPLRGARGATVEQVEDVVDVALVECERFYPAFQYVVWGGKDPAEAVAAACLEPMGEA